MRQRTIQGHFEKRQSPLLGALIATVMAGGSINLYAAENAEQVLELNSTVVTASANAVDVRDAPASVTVITAEDIQKIPSADLNDILKRAPGLSVATTPDGGTSIQIRGLPQGYSLLLVDGRRVGSSKETYDRYSRNEVNWIPPESIERIEIIRGPMSSLYGADAMGGVINIITKKAGSFWEGSARANAVIDESSIRGNDYTGGFSLRGPLMDGLRLSLNGEQTYQQPDSELPADRSAFRWGGGREGSKLRSFGGQLSWDITEDHELSLHYQKAERRTLPGPNAAGSNPTANASTRGPREMDREEFGLSYAGGHGFATSKLSINRTEYRNKTTGPVIVNNVNAGNVPTEAVATDLVVDGSVTAPFSLGVEQSLTLGAQWQRNELDNPNSVGSVPNAEGVLGLSYKETHSKSLYAEDQLFLRDDLILTLGARFDDHDDFDSRVSPRAYVVYHPSYEWTLRGGYSEGFKAPTLRQSNPNFVGQSQGAGCAGGFAPCSTRGSADLEPEISKNWELGVGWERDLWEAGLTFFHSDFENKIATRYVGLLNGQHFYENYNAGDAVIRGIEGNITVPVVENLLWRTNVTHMLEAEEKRKDASGYRAPLSVTPELSIASMLDWTINDALNTSLQAQYLSKQVGLDWREANQSGQSGSQRIQSGYTIFDLGLGYRVNRNFHVNTGITNLFDRDPNGVSNTGNNFYTPGRRYFVTLTASF
ncbi:TonB-dependent receptor [Pseudomonas sp. ABC1]|uniref:TonB-dependent receptor domain-containing protein n=1 Tax=Pseudomonas sp. ABC1 TaxID=2748080 RepID=UPI0015C321ED|nr:TonB-dependent receptor [Pseudomonas sp. ABC1]QLF93908.1 TonB-dependent receptor [Pseudomonas sp. ABC1]